MTAAPLLPLAFLIDALAGETPLVRCGDISRTLARLAAGAERRLNRAWRSPATRMVRGTLVVCLLAGLAAAVGYGLARLAAAVPFFWVLEALVIAALLDQKRAFLTVLRLSRRRGKKDMPSAMTGEDSYAAARAALDTLSAGYGARLVAGGFWLVLLGLPGLFAYRAIAVLGAGRMLPGAGQMAAGGRGAFDMFGQTPARLYLAVSLAPGLLAGLCLVLASLFAPRAAPRPAAAQLTLAPADGAARAVFAGALGLNLGVPGAWVGPPDGRARVSRTDVQRGLYLYAVAWLIALGLAAAAAVPGMTIEGSGG
jgi:adenosylcobinamide-phosphate synthase